MRFLTRKLVQPGDLNANGTLFGGRLLAWVDEEAAIFAGIETRHKKVVTKRVSEIDFVAPARQGDIVEIGVRLKKVGITSITLEVQVRDLTNQSIIVEIDEMVFVCVDETGRPVKHSLRK
ncbi:acyl-CoA thioesterase [bacterium]|nr:acyl-CoA thioesterase [bacterium]